MIIVASKDSHPVNYLETMRVNGRIPGQIAVSDRAMREYSHVFNLENWWPPQLYPVLEVPKASRREVEYGLYHLPLREVFKSRLYRLSFRRNPHPCPRPVKLMMYLLAIFSKPGDRILDPFVGQGTTAHACYLMGRRFIGTERNKEFADVARRKLKALRAANRPTEAA
jgi:DNA modification methylase